MIIFVFYLFCNKFQSWTKTFEIPGMYTYMYMYYVIERFEKNDFSKNGNIACHSTRQRIVWPATVSGWRTNIDCHWRADGGVRTSMTTLRVGPLSCPVAGKTIIVRAVWLLVTEKRYAVNLFVHKTKLTRYAARYLKNDFADVCFKR